jgi:hypothetical protein
LEEEATAAEYNARSMAMPEAASERKLGKVSAYRDAATRLREALREDFQTRTSPTPDRQQPTIPTGVHNINMMAKVLEPIHRRQRAFEGMVDLVEIIPAGAIVQIKDVTPSKGPFGHPNGPGAARILVHWGGFTPGVSESVRYTTPAFNLELLP